MSGSRNDFDRFIGIDWASGGDDARAAAGLRVVAVGTSGKPKRIYPERPNAKNWRRDDIRDVLLQDELDGGSDHRTLVGIDAALGYPFGAADEIFDAENWRDLTDKIGILREKADSLADFRRLVNESVVRDREDRNLRGAPFFSHDQSDKDWWQDRKFTRQGFFSHTGISYYRVVELLVPQAISTFYGGAGAKVGGHTITCLDVLHELLEQRDHGDGSLDFAVWLHEKNWRQHKHLVAECYPSILPEPRNTAPEEMTDDEIDAYKIAESLAEMSEEGRLEEFLSIDRAIADERFHRVLNEEGWILGVKPPQSGLRLLNANAPH